MRIKDEVYIRPNQADVGEVSVDDTPLTTMEAVSAQTVLVSALRGEIARLRESVAAEQERARVAESQLARVHRAVRAAQTNVKDVKARRNQILAAAQEHAAEVVRQAQVEAEQVSSRSPSTYSGLGEHDESLDERLDQYLQAEMEPDASRTWMLGDRSS